MQQELLAFYNGDTQILEKWYTTFYAKLKRTAYRQLRDHQYAEDIINDVYLTIAAIPIPERRKKFKPKNSILAAFQIRVKNRCIDFIRWQNRRIRPVELGEVFNLAAEPMDSEELPRVNKSLKLLIDEAITKGYFSELDQDILELILSGITNKVIAEKLRIGEKKVAKHKHKMKRRLQRMKIAQSSL